MSQATIRQTGQFEGRIEELKGYIEEVVKQVKGEVSQVEVCKPAVQRCAGEVAIICRLKDRTEFWAMKLCRCCPVPSYEGFELKRSEPVN